jgi:SAM-dependent methyltransferase
VANKLTHPESAERTLRVLSEQLIGSAAQSHPGGNCLTLWHPLAPRIDAGQTFGFANGNEISLKLTDIDGASDDRSDNPLACSAGSLPFQDGVFRTVLLHHLIARGEEAVLAESCRVLAQDGVLLLLGLNRWGCRYLAQRRRQRLPGLAPFKVRSSLETLHMNVQAFAGAGLFNRSRTESLASGLPAAAAPLADVVILKVRHGDKPAMTSLRFRKPRSNVVQSAAIRG